ncbi:helix-turn-helix domain-containing protein [Bacteroides nordii]|uniref:helix-turn-helix domain-containing protein n=1 Tax=Bacteroides nordii TaxID=291645 RepID=UPI0021E648D7|nr:helix-turn-helix domain-containing protein [Bacteroides nordii]
MNALMIDETTPIAALTVGQFRELFNMMATPAPIVPSEEAPEVFDKKRCSEITGYSINTINRFICERKIPYYKSYGRVFFKREEILNWMLSQRFETAAEFCYKKDNELTAKRR